MEKSSLASMSIEQFDSMINNRTAFSVNVLYESYKVIIMK